MVRGRAAAAALGLSGALLLAVALPASASAPVPRLSGPVVDETGVLDASWTRRLDQLARAGRAEHGGAGPQLQFLLVNTTDGEAIEDYSMRVAEAWKLGTKGRDDGVLVVVALKDRKVRIEVGGGIEGGLTDVQAGRIIRNAIAPAFREGKYGAGLYAAGQQILGALGALPQGMAQQQRPKRQDGLPLPFGVLVFLLIFGLIVARAVSAARRGIWRGPRGPWGGGWGGGGFGGGGWSGGGGGGGGWSGGGGGFSGGGASGSW